MARDPGDGPELLRIWRSPVELFLSGTHGTVPIFWKTSHNAPCGTEHTCVYMYHTCLTEHINMVMAGEATRVRYYEAYVPITPTHHLVVP